MSQETEYKPNAIGLKLKEALAAFKGEPNQALAKTQSDLEAAKASLASSASELAQAKAAVATLSADLEAAKASLASSASATEALASVASAFGLKASDLLGHKPEEVEALLAEKVSASAREQIASLGFNPNKLPAPTEDVKGKTCSSEEWEKMSFTEKKSFLNAGGAVL